MQAFFGLPKFAHVGERDDAAIILAHLDDKSESEGMREGRGDVDRVYEPCCNEQLRGLNTK